MEIQSFPLPKNSATPTGTARPVSRSLKRRLASPAGDRQRSAPEATSWRSTLSCSRTAQGQPYPRIAQERLRLRLRLSAHQHPPGARPLCDRLPAAPATGNARNPGPHQRHRLCPPLYTNIQYKTNLILAGVGGGNSTFSITKKQRHTKHARRNKHARRKKCAGRDSHPDRQRSSQATAQKTNPGRPRLTPGLAAFRENRRQTTATQWRGYTV